MKYQITYSGVAPDRIVQSAGEFDTPEAAWKEVERRSAALASRMSDYGVVGIVKMRCVQVTTEVWEQVP